ncbi:MAG: hypothetical protein IKZ96_01060 [Bacilli bacterium]|nr:hypothetical protein [Bacilli bacterium]
MIKDTLNAIKNEKSTERYWVPVRVPKIMEEDNIKLPKFEVVGKPLTLDQVQAEVTLPKDYIYNDILTNAFTEYTKSGYDLDGIHLVGECSFYCSVDSLKQLYSFLNIQYREAESFLKSYNEKCISFTDVFGNECKPTDKQLESYREIYERKIYELRKAIEEYVRGHIQVLPFAKISFNEIKPIYSEKNDPNNCIPVYANKNNLVDFYIVNAERFSEIAKLNGYEETAEGITDLRISNGITFLRYAIRSCNGTAYGLRAWVNEPEWLIKKKEPTKIYKDEDK